MTQEPDEALLYALEKMEPVKDKFSLEHYANLLVIMGDSYRAGRAASGDDADVRDAKFLLKECARRLEARVLGADSVENSTDFARRNDLELVKLANGVRLKGHDA
ncbi:MAG: hypothetical protein IM647_11400 [Phenylobacterium sp.]|uniref:hypothetical protein n=1 Tax=Phenylobacterium sp. TaxID=1871053 RepID=UPI0025E5AC59|nr:hypothetical protein [Phenylobacterium sp.]MCA6308375.1 hypothetical protein [Phenylobacterium sp.]MCA6318839.1 hypothetical protein [Phenylobacterium sp.]